MDQILQQVERARRRLWLELFLNRLLRCWFAALAVAVVAIGAPKLVAIENLPDNWSLLCAAVAVVGGLVVAIGWMWLGGRSQLDAAMEIDHRYGLKERVASSLLLSSAEADTPAGQALLSDAVRAVRRIDVDERFRLRLSRRPWLPLVPALIAFFLATMVDNRTAQSSIDPASKLTKKQLDETAKALRERLVERRKQAASKGLKEAEGLFRELEKETEKMAETRDADRKKSLVKLSDLGQQLQQRRQQLGGENELRKQFSQMKNLNRGPADRMIEAMQQGDWNTAAQQLKNLQQKLASGKLDKQAQQELAEQLKQLEKNLADAAAARQQVMNDLKRQIEQKREEGDLAQAAELQQKLDQLKQQNQQNNKLQDLAQKMGQCQQCMQQGDNAGAAQAAGEMLQQLQQMQQDMDEAELLDAALDQLEMAKGAMGENAQQCDQCQGQGCEGCMGGMCNKFGQKMGPGMALGPGGGKRPDEKDDVRFRDSRVRQKTGRGAAVVVGEADGPNIRGQVAQAIKQEMAAQGSQPADPLVSERLPKSRREHAEQYFNSLREGR